MARKSICLILEEDALYKKFVRNQIRDCDIKITHNEIMELISSCPPYERHILLTQDQQIALGKLLNKIEDIYKHKE